MIRDVAFGIDDRFVEQLICTIYGVRKNISLEVGLRFHVLFVPETLSEENKKRITLFSHGMGCDLHFIDASSVISDRLKWSDKDHLSVATYYRLFLPVLLPDDIKSVLYLDVDVLIWGCLNDLFAYFDRAEICAVDHFSPEDEVRMWGAKGGTYFNAGVLIFNLDLMRKREVLKAFENILDRDKGRIRWHDQDVLNIAYQDKWERMPYIYNLTRSAAEKGLDKIEAPVIVHFDGWKKPWLQWVDRPYANEWRDLYKEVFGVVHPTAKATRLYLRKIRNTVSRAKNTIRFLFGI